MDKLTTTNTQSPSPQTARRKRGAGFYVKRGLLIIILLLVAVSVVGMTYQTVAEASDKATYLPPGQMVTVDGHLMHINCTGTGSPTIILEAGAYSFSSEWYWVQHQLESTNRVCSYDRAGNGWSETVGGPRDGLTIAHDLHALLKAASVAPPYIMVGHSLGGVTNSIYAREYPAEVQGLVLVDSAVPIGLNWTDAEFQNYMDTNASAYGVMMTLGRVGALRFIIRNEFRGYGYPALIVDELTAFKSTLSAVNTWDAEVRLAQWELSQQANAARDAGALPLVVLWAGHPELTAPEDRAKLEAIWTLVPVSSSNSATRIVDGSDHGSIIGNMDYAAQVTQAVHDVLESIRSDQPVAH
ncbi:MAG: alpha/beta fold hydrolase [Anaerolineaceae bacterium]|nr:alpha/beta fold hydrolase [Anaerolineaceae bacterium]